MITESIFNGEDCVIPMADVGYCSKYANGNFFVVIKGWVNDKFGAPSNEIFLPKEESKKFLEAWKRYRHEVDGVDCQKVQDESK